MKVCARVAQGVAEAQKSHAVAHKQFGQLGQFTSLPMTFSATVMTRHAEDRESKHNRAQSSQVSQSPPSSAATQHPRAPEENVEFLCSKFTTLFNHLQQSEADRDRSEEEAREWQLKCETLEKKAVTDEEEIASLRAELAESQKVHMLSLRASAEERDTEQRARDARL